MRREIEHATDDTRPGVVARLIAELRRAPAKLSPSVQAILAGLADDGAPITEVDDDLLLLPRDAARLIGLSEAWLAKARMNEGGTRFLKLGRNVAYRRCDCRAWLASRERLSTLDDKRAVLPDPS